MSQEYNHGQSPAPRYVSRNHGYTPSTDEASSFIAKEDELRREIANLSRQVEQNQYSRLTMEQHHHASETARVAAEQELHECRARMEHQAGFIRELEQEVARLRQEDLALQSSSQGFKSPSNHERAPIRAPPDIATKEELDRLQRQLEEQEMLIVGYQKENERLTARFKEEKAQQAEDRFMAENRRLRQELEGAMAGIADREEDVRAMKENLDRMQYALGTAKQGEIQLLNEV